MKNPNICGVLKHYRKINRLTVKDVSMLLKDHNLAVAPKTIYGWESGQTQPNADTLMLLCEIYKIDNVLETFGYRTASSSSGIQLSKKEEELILKYRENPDMHPAIAKLLNMHS